MRNSARRRATSSPAILAKLSTSLPALTRSKSLWDNIDGIWQCWKELTCLQATGGSGSTTIRLRTRSEIRATAIGKKNWLFALYRKRRSRLEKRGHLQHHRKLPQPGHRSSRLPQRRAYSPAKGDQLGHPQPHTRRLGENASDAINQPRRRIINDVATRLQNI